MGTPTTPVKITAKTSMSIYVNNVYHILSPDIPLVVHTDDLGTITVVQETQNLEATPLTITVPGESPLEETVKPMSKILQTLSSIKSGDDLAKVQIPTGNGDSKPLIPKDMLDSKDDIATALAQLADVTHSLPDDGSVQKPALVRSRLRAGPAEPVEPSESWGLTFEKGAVQYHKGDDAMRLLISPESHKMLANSQNPIELGDIGDVIRAKAGAFWRWAKRIFNDVKAAVMHKLDGIWHFVCTIAKKTYAVALDCYHAVAGAIEFVLRHIKVFFADVVAWLGFVFSWNDILRTHSVFKNMFIQYSRHIVDQFDSLENTIEKAFIGFEDQLNSWADITDPGETIGTHLKGAAEAPGQNLPQAHWGVYHTKNGLKSAETTYEPDSSVSGDLKAMLKDLIDMVDNEGKYIKDTATQLKDSILDNIDSLRPVQAMKKIMAIMGDLILKSARNVIVTLVDLLKLIAKGFIDILSVPLKIPVLSRLYREVTQGSELSVLDLFCLVTAIPATVIHKITVNRAPFPDNDSTTALICASDWDELRKALSAKSSQLQTYHGVQQQSELNDSDGESVVAPNVKGIDESLLTTIQGTCDIIAPIGAAILVLLDTDMAKSAGVGKFAPFNIGAYLVLISPNIANSLHGAPDWMTVFNDVITGIAVAKTVADNLACVQVANPSWSVWASPLLEGYINLIWFVPSGGWIASSYRSEGGAKPSDWTSLAGAIYGVVYAVAAYHINEGVPEPLRIIAAIFAKAATLRYGSLSFLTGCLLLKGH